MVLILGAKNDISTIEVAEWLLYYGKEYLILYTEERNFKIKKYSFDSKEFIIMVNNKEYNLFDVTAVWNRRRGTSPVLFTKAYIKNESVPFFIEANDNSHISYVRDESSVLLSFLHYFVENNATKVIGSYFTDDVNKLIVLEKALESGLKIPRTSIVSTKEELASFLMCSKIAITKAINEGIYRPDVREKYLYYSYVERITSDTLKDFPLAFYPSLVQEEIIKELDIRVFYFCGKFYAMAIFSQDEEDAVTDFRKNDHRAHPLKFVPYSLPEAIKDKLHVLMSKLGLNTGSIDIILSKEQEYYFLEVNPCGQFKMTSDPCNYYLEKLIAQSL